MSSSPTLNWALIAVSLFNTILLLWLGLTVLLNADRRAWGIWLGGGGLLLGAVFFLSHTALLGLGLSFIGWNMIFWWTAGLVPALLLPFAWYLTMLWYAGFWEPAAGPPSALRRRQRPWLALVSLMLLAGLAGLAVGVLLLATPSQHLTWLRLYIRFSIGGIPLMALGYSIFVILCIGLSLDALARPGPSGRIMGQQARQRARPWLMATSLSLLLVSLIVAFTMAWLVQELRGRTLAEVYGRMAGPAAWLDLVTAAIIAVSILLLGQAVVAYEVFTGRTLPRRGLARHWQRTVALAAGFSFLVGGSFALGLRPLYTVVLATFLMTLALAVLSWRSYAEREQTIRQLRPILASQQLYDRMLGPEDGSEPSAPADPPALLQAFAGLCRELLGARFAYLAPLGPLAPLAGPPLAYPADRPADLPYLSELAEAGRSPDTLILPIREPGRFGGAEWAVPLWSSHGPGRGLSGLLLLGPKRDGGLYGQEEIEMARLSSERLLDSQAGAEMGRRLVALQRRRLVESQMADLLARRVLHDEVLPNLQAALIALDSRPVPAGARPGAGSAQAAVAAGLLSDSHRRIADLLRQIPTVTTADLDRLGLVAVLQRAVDDELAGDFDDLNWQIAPGAEEAARRLPPAAAEVLFYAAREAARNAARHGRGPQAPLHLRIALTAGDGFAIVVEDNGVGLAGSAGEDGRAAGSGQGLALYSTMMAVIGGSLAVDSAPGRYTCVRLHLP
jgi:signal transduction histidine kinase